MRLPRWSRRYHIVRDVEDESQQAWDGRVGWRVYLRNLLRIEHQFLYILREPIHDIRLPIN